jgi:hypothetical protein
MIDFTSAGAIAYAAVRAKLERADTPISPLDTLIASKRSRASSQWSRTTSVSFVGLSDSPSKTERGDLPRKVRKFEYRPFLPAKVLTSVISAEANNTELGMRDGLNEGCLLAHSSFEGLWTSTGCMWPNSWQFAFGTNMSCPCSPSCRRMVRR